MNRTHPMIFPMSLLAASIFCLQPAHAIGEATHLFNGKDLGNFYTFIKDRGRDTDPKRVFTVQDGMLRISGEEWGCVTTVEEYENYHLVAEFKWGDEAFAPRVDKARDSGILVHSIGEDGGYSGVWMHSIECQLIEGGTGDLLVVGDGTNDFNVTCPVRIDTNDKGNGAHYFDPDGELVTITGGRINWWGRDSDWKDVFNFRGKKDVEKPIGEWNTLECIADSNTLTVILNGVTVNRAVDCKPTKGRIQIQAEGAEIFFRRVDLLPLEKTVAGARPDDYRFIYNSDGNNMFIYADPPMTPEKLYPYIDEIVATPATTLFMCPNFGMVPGYRSKITPMIGDDVSAELAATIESATPAPPKSTERGVQNLHALVEAGHDPFGLIVDRAHAKGLEVFASFRPNEIHAVDQDDHLILSRFWKEHPEWRVGNKGDAVAPIYQEILGPNVSPIVASWFWGALNFAIPEVRALRLAELRELCENYDIDGLDLDFQRFPIYFPMGSESEHIGTMTEWMRAVRAVVKDVGEKRGRPISLSARIMARPEQNLAIGLDPVTWASEGLLDFVTVSHYLRNDYPLPIADYRRLLPEDMPIYASIEVERTEGRYIDLGNQLWQAGADGLMVFNFFTTRERGEEPPFSVLSKIAAPPSSRRFESGKPVLLVVNKHGDTMSFVNPVTLEKLAQVPAGHDPHEMAITPDRRFAYLSNYAPPGNTVSVIDLVHQRHVLQIPTDPYTRIHCATMTRDGRYAYFTAGQTGYVVEIDTSTNTVTRGIPTHGKISHMVILSPDESRLYTANIESQNVSVIDRVSGELVTQVPCEKGCEGMAFRPDGKELWVANQNAGTITMVNPESNTVIETVPCPGMPLRIRFTADGSRALISNWVAEGELVVMDVASRTEVKRIRVGNQPIGVEISPDGSRAFVTNMTSNDIHVIDLGTLEVAARFEIGLGSDAMGWWYPPE